MAQGRLQYDFLNLSLLSDSSCSLVSSLLIIAISAEKYLAVCFPFWHQANVTTKKASIVCTIVAMVSLAMFLARSITTDNISIYRKPIIMSACIAHLLFFWSQVKLFIVVSRIKKESGQSKQLQLIFINIGKIRLLSYSLASPLPDPTLQ